MLPDPYFLFIALYLTKWFAARSAITRHTAVWAPLWTLCMVNLRLPSNYSSVLDEHLSVTPRRNLTRAAPGTPRPPPPLPPAAAAADTATARLG